MTLADDIMTNWDPGHLSTLRMIKRMADKYGQIAARYSRQKATTKNCSALRYPGMPWVVDEKEARPFDN
jgi:hypothetical protein